MDLAVAAKSAQQLLVAATISWELTVAEQPSLGIEHGSVMGTTMGVDPADDNPGVVGHAEVAFPLDDRAGRARTGRAGGPVTRLGRATSYQVTRARPIACTTRGPAGQADSSPEDTKVRSVPSQTRQQDQPHDQGPPHLHWSGQSRST
jgi:hypothetical protein